MSHCILQIVSPSKVSGYVGVSGCHNSSLIFCLDVQAKTNPVRSPLTAKSNSHFYFAPVFTFIISAFNNDTSVSLHLYKPFSDFSHCLLCLEIQRSSIVSKLLQ